MRHFEHATTEDDESLEIAKACGRAPETGVRLKCSEGRIGEGGDQKNLLTCI